MSNLASLCALVSAALGAAAGCDLADPGASGTLVPRTADEDPSLPSIELDGTRLHLETFGDPASPPIVFLHGGPGGDYRGFARLLEPTQGRRLQDDYYLILWDQRGAGLSQRHDAAELTIDRYLADLDLILDRYAGGRPVVLVGHSWGGMFASAYLDHAPERVRAAVLLEPGPLTGALFTELEDRLIDLDLTSEWANDLLWSQRFLSADDHARLDYKVWLVDLVDAQPGYHLSRTDPEPMWRFGAVAQLAIQDSGTERGVAVWNFVRTTRSYPGLVHLVAGGANIVIGPEFQARQADFFRAPRLTVVDGAGHDFPWTHAAQTLAAIRATLAELEDPGVVAASVFAPRVGAAVASLRPTAQPGAVEVDHVR